MDSKLIISQSDDECINQHHEMECTTFNIIEANTLNIDINNPSYQPLTDDSSKHTLTENSNENNQHLSSKSTDKNTENQQKEEEKKEEPTTAWYEIKTMFKLAIPVSFTSIARIVMWNTDQIFLGHLGTKELAGAELADTCMEILTMFVYTPAWSLNGLCSQALGSGNPIMAGYWLQLTIIICTILCIPVSIGYFYISDLINAFSHDDIVVEYSKKFAHYAVLFLWTNAMLSAIRLFHQSLEIVNPFTIISMIAIILNIIGNQLWLYGLNINLFGRKLEFDGLGFIGSPLATSTSMCLQLIMYYLLCFKLKKYYSKHKTWNGWSLKQTILNKKRLKEYAKVVIPLIVSNASENWGYQVVILCSATLDAAEIAAMSCTFGVWGMLWSFYSGFGSAIVTRVGKKIGSGDIKQAKLVSKIGLFLSVTTCFLTSLVIFLLKHQVAMTFSNDSEVILLMHQTIQLLCVLYVIGGIGWCAMNILEAMSKNKAKGIINVTSAWFGYVPACVYFMSGDNHTLVHISPVSCIFMVGIIVEAFRTVSLWIIVFCTDWKKAIIEAQKRNDKYDDMVRDEDKQNKEEEDKNDQRDLEYVCLDKLEDEEGGKKIEDGLDKKYEIINSGEGLKYGLLDVSNIEAAAAV